MSSPLIIWSSSSADSDKRDVLAQHALEVGLPDGGDILERERERFAPIAVRNVVVPTVMAPAVCGTFGGLRYRVRRGGRA